MTTERAGSEVGELVERLREVADKLDKFGDRVEVRRAADALDRLTAENAALVRERDAALFDRREQQSVFNRMKATCRQYDEDRCKAEACAESAERERDRLREGVAELVACLHRPSPRNPDLTLVSPGRHRDFEAAITKLERAALARAQEEQQ